MLKIVPEDSESTECSLKPEGRLPFRCFLEGGFGI
jgi:hypothetical protein